MDVFSNFFQSTDRKQLCLPDSTKQVSLPFYLKTKKDPSFETWYFLNFFRIFKKKIMHRLSSKTRRQSFRYEDSDDNNFDSKRGYLVIQHTICNNLSCYDAGNCVYVLCIFIVGTSSTIPLVSMKLFEGRPSLAFHYQSSARISFAFLDTMCR